MSFKSLPIKVGILGGGQLAQMMALAAHGLGVRPVIFAQKTTDCALQVASHVFWAHEPQALEKFIDAVDVVTIENEFLDLDELSLELKKARKKMFPSLKTLGMIQSKLDQKESLKKSKLPTLDFIPIKKRSDLEKAWTQFDGQVVLKTARFGYDGKGTFIFKKEQKKWNAFCDGFKESSEVWGYAEPLARYKKELAVMVVRDLKGNIKSYPVIETFQSEGICQWAMAPAQIPTQSAKMAQEVAKKVIAAFDGVGAFGVEMFLLDGGKIVINEIAPRVHNSGHLTMDACRVGQFEEHLRAVLGFPLEETDLIVSGAAMVNIIGKKTSSDIDNTVPFNGKSDGLTPQTWLHWYGKVGPALGRKLGHINAWGKSPSDALKRALRMRKKILI